MLSIFIQFKAVKMKALNFALGTLMIYSFVSCGTGKKPGVSESPEPLVQEIPGGKILYKWPSKNKTCETDPSVLNSKKVEGNLKILDAIDVGAKFEQNFEKIKNISAEHHALEYAKFSLCSDWAKGITPDADFKAKTAVLNYAIVRIVAPSVTLCPSFHSKYIRKDQPNADGLVWTLSSGSDGDRCKLTGSSSTSPSGYTHTMSGEFKTGASIATVSIERVRLSDNCTTTMFGKLYHFEDMFVGEIDSAKVGCGLPSNYKESSIFYREINNNGKIK
jgi:hypothetical protein